MISAFIIGFTLMLVPTLLAKTPFIRQYALVIRANKHSYIILTLQGRFFIETRNQPFFIGDIVKISGERTTYSFAMVEGDFNYALYLKNSGVYSSLRVKAVETIIPSLFRYFNPTFLVAVVYPSHLAPLRDAFLIRSIDYDNDLLKVAAQNDLLFLITLSGAHLSFIRRLNKKILLVFMNEKRSELYSNVLLIPLFILNVTKFAFYRIFLGAILRAFNKYKLDSYFTSLELNAVLAIIFLLINPFLLFNAAFYLAFTLIILFNIVHPAPNLKGRLVSIALVLFVIIPYKIFNSGVLNVSSVFLPFMMTPLLSLWLVTYFLVLPFPPLHNVSITILNLIYYLVQGATYIKITLYFAPYSPIVITIISILLLFFLFTLSARMKRLSYTLASVLAFSLLCSFIPFSRHFYYRLTFINVGQGDSILLETPKKTALIDTGGLYNRDIAREVLIPFFYRRNIYKIDYLITTHDDFDHNGGVASLRQSFKVGTYIKEKAAFPLDVSDITLFNLNPYTYGDDNLDSLIIYFSLPTFDVLLMADAGVSNEKTLMRDYPNINVDILKVGHHGSNTSSAPSFISHYKPDVAIISAGYNNKYGHPHADVLKTLENNNVLIRRTDLEGTITLKSSII